LNMSDWDQPNRKARRAVQKASGSESEGEASASASGSDAAAKKRPKPKGQSIQQETDQLLKAAKPNTQYIPVFVMVAAIMSIAPAYLYSNVYDLPLVDYGVLYLLSVGASVGLLAYSYQIVNTSHNAILLNQRKGNSLNPKLPKELGYSAKELDNCTKKVSAHEAFLYSLLFNNTVYLIVFFFLAFYLFRDVYTPWNYLISQTATAGLTYWLAQTMSK